jgi:multicomponent K+:H+ antiporter subunit D
LGAAGLLLLVVFGLKAAAFPLYFWLPRAYAAASAPVAALFAILTKVGLYAILRIGTLVFGADAGELSHLFQNALWVAALLTLILGAIGALAADTLERLIAYLVVVSVGTIAAGVALQTPDAIAATLYYLTHSTFIAGAFFLLAGELTRMRGEAIAGRLVAGPSLPNPMLSGGLFFIGAVSVAGMPPLSGFIGKLLLLSSVQTASQTAWLFAAVLGGGLLVIIALSRAGSTLFWRCNKALIPAGRPDAWRLGASGALLLASVLLVIFAKPFLDYLEAAAVSLVDPQAYIRAVLPWVSAGHGGAP